jgi:DnaJ-domain-containing protein 1
LLAPFVQGNVSADVDCPIFAQGSHLMFDRNHSHSHQERVDLPVRLVCEDGREQLVSIIAGADRSVGAVLNGADMFIQIETPDGVSRYISKSSICSAEPVVTPRTDQLKRKLSPSGTFDPYRILGAEPGSNVEDLRAAYRKKAAEYHPDRYASMGLPKEMLNYVDSMARNINMAWQEVSQSKKVA